MDKDYEFEFYEDIMECTLKFFNDQDKILQIICQKIIELMRLLDITEFREFVKNALIIVIALFEDEESGMIFSKGIDINDLSNQDKEEVYNLLRLELAN